MKNYLNKTDLDIWDLLLMLSIATIFATAVINMGFRIYGK